MNGQLMWLLCAKLLQSCLTLCYPVDCSPPISSVRGILQAGILEWFPCPFPDQLMIYHKLKVGSVTLDIWFKN